MTETLERPAADAASAPERADAWLSAFEEALTARDVDRAAAMFAAQSWWRDLVSFSWNITTVEHPEGVRDLLTATLESTSPSALRDQRAAHRGRRRRHRVVHLRDGRRPGHRAAAPQGGGRRRPGVDLPHHPRRAEGLRGAASATGGRRGAEHGADKGRATWKERRQAEAESLGSTTQPYVLVIGGGQGGIGLGARLRQLGVPSLVIDKHPRPGDQWRNRYKSLCLHDPVWYDHLPYLKFPDNWPVFAPKDKIGDWLESYVKVMEVPYWSDTVASSATWSDETGEWTVEVEREGQPLTLRPTQIVFATGMSGKPRMPDVAGLDVFRGDVHHSSRHPGPDAYRGRRAVVIGSNNSAFDICGALWENDVDVTMVQRSSTHIVKSDSLMEYGLGDLYSERALAAGVTTEKADLIFASLPYRILHEFQIPAYEKMAEVDKDFYDRLERAGFWLDWGDDGSGLFMKYLRRGSGYYIDVGAADLVANGDVKLVHGQVDHLTEDAVVLTDGTELPADVVVFATGYNSMNGWVADLIDQETADRLGKCWGLGSDTTKDPGPWEGEQRNMWKPTQVANLWMHGGNLHQSRHYSLYLALQLKARYEGLDTPVYRLQEVNHTG